jgi:hypothetical protein
MGIVLILLLHNGSQILRFVRKCEVSFQRTPHSGVTFFPFCLNTVPRVLFILIGANRFAKRRAHNSKGKGIVK